MISFAVTFDDYASPVLSKLEGALTGAEKTSLNEVGARQAVDAAARFHREFDKEGGWRGKRSFGSGGSTFGAAVAKGWYFSGADSEGADIANNAEHYGFKVRGGTIIPKRVGFLTIPLVREAHGRRARDYEIFFRRRLFTLPGRNVLFERVSAGGDESAFVRIFGQYKKGQKSTAVRGRRATIQPRQQLRAVYALLKSVTQPPWPDAIPPDDIILDAFQTGWLKALDDAIDAGEISANRRP